jgi:exopolysaccharide biosynthesis polyprenyl glycosylphosphotransferase
MHIQTIGGLPLLYVDEPEFTGLRRVAKGGLDLGLALLALALLSPVMLAVAVAIRLDSPGPVLFRQVRIGRDSKPFQMTKFRSMHVDAEERLTQLAHLNQHGGGPLFKMREDPRVTRVGAVLRRFSLDELPQLFDVLRRRMSLVGPRPPLPREVEAYEDDVRRRLLVKPGITGLWQVSGRSDLTWDESVRLDLSYVENWSLGLDLSIIARTVVAVLARRGAY